MIWHAAWMNSQREQSPREELVSTPLSSDSGISPDGRRILNAIDNISVDEREVFDLIRIQDDAARGRRVPRRCVDDGEAAIESKRAAVDGTSR